MELPYFTLCQYKALAEESRPCMYIGLLGFSSPAPGNSLLPKPSQKAMDLQMVDRLV